MDLNKDIYEYLTNFADDKTILSMLSVNKKFRDDEFFRRVLQRRYPLLLRFKKGNQTYKDLYIRMVYYIYKLKEEYDIPYVANPDYNPESFYRISAGEPTWVYTRIMSTASEIGDIETIKLMMEKGVDNFDFGLMFSVKSRNMDVIKFFLDKGADINYGLRGATELGDMKMINFMINNGARDWNKGLVGATTGGNMEIVKLMIDNGADDFETGLFTAAENGHMDIFKMMIELMGDDIDLDTINYALMAASGNKKDDNMDIINYLIELGADDFETALYVSANSGNINRMIFFVEKGAKNFNEVLKDTISFGHLDVVKFLVEKGANNFDEAIEEAKKYKQFDIMDYLIKNKNKNK